MGTNAKTAGVAGVEVLVAGQPLDQTLTPLLQEVRVEDNLTLPDAFLVRISDPGLKNIDSHPLDVGTEIEIRIGSPDGSGVASRTAQRGGVDARSQVLPGTSTTGVSIRVTRSTSRAQPARVARPPLTRWWTATRSPAGASSSEPSSSAIASARSGV